MGIATFPTAPGAAPAAGVLAEVLIFLDREQEALCREYADICAQSVDRRLASGHALGPMTLLGPAADGLLRLRLAEHGSRYREGDYGYLGPPAVGEAAIGRGLPVKYVRFEQASQTLVLERDAKERPKAGTPDLRGPLYFDNRKVDLTKLYAKAATRALACPLPSPLVRAMVLDGESSRDEWDWSRFVMSGAQAGLDPSQREAYASRAIFPLALVQGPPGTGKTRVLAEVTAGLLEDGCRVLVCAMAHRAVNNALDACAERAPAGAPIIKLGDPTQARNLDERVERLEQRDDAVGRLARWTGPALLGTSVARAPGLAEKGVHFDVVIFDEAGQLTLPQVLCGAIAAPRAILFGDHKQLPPIVQAEHPKAGRDLSRSAFEILLDRHPAAMLEVSYRLNAELVAFPSRAFYRGELVASPASAVRRLTVRFPPEHPLFPLLDPDAPLVWGEVDHRFRGVPCDEEADIAAECVRLALEAGLPPKELGVISPFRAQNQAIRKRLRALARGGLDGADEVVVDTVERMQGQEREMVVVSLTLSDPQAIEQQAGFIFSPNRLNVSVTRAKTKCIVLGSPELLAPRSRDAAVLRGAAMLRELVAVARSVPVPSAHPAPAPNPAAPQPFPAPRPIGETEGDRRSWGTRLRRLVRGM